MKIIITLIVCCCFGCVNQSSKRKATNTVLPAPYATKSVIKESKITAWPEGKTPQAPDGFIVSVFADSIVSPRWIYETPNGDILVSCSQTNKETSPNNIILFRDTNNDGVTDIQDVFLENLSQPLGMLVLKNWFYVANTDGLYRYAYNQGDLDIKVKGEKILELPAGGYNNHWTRNILTNPTGTKIYVSVGSGSNNGENGMDKEIRRAAILEINPDGTGERIFAEGIRNPVGMDWQPGTNTLWTVVNERDELGDDLVPDYLTSVKEGGFYGWPYAYFGQNEDPRMKGLRPDLIAKTIVPDLALGAHTASLGLAFYTKKVFPSKYHNGAFIGQHGSWNRSKFAGYKVLFVPFSNGKPGIPEDFLTGFISNEEKDEVNGRPVAVYVTSNGSLLIADDAANIIWKVTAVIK